MNSSILLKTAVLLITFKRLDTTKQVFEAIRKAKPPRLYISSNIGRDNEENESVYNVRSFLENNIDWECEVIKLYRTEHLSAKSSISGAIDWFFENEEMGIILEDDCLPSQSFFIFCQELLEKYKNEQDVLHIGGTNPIDKELESNSYYFSKYNRIWGWASWRRAWTYFDPNINIWPKIKAERLLYDLFDRKEAKYFEKIFDSVYKNEIDTWDYQWFLMRLLNGKAVIPNVNLVSNLGFSENSTNTKDIEHPLSNLPRGEIMFPLDHPKSQAENVGKDKQWSRMVTIKPSIIQRIMGKIKR